MAYLLNGSKEAAGKQVAQMFERDSAKGEALLHELCDHLLDPQKPFINNKDAIEWIKVLFGGQAGFESMCNKIRSLDSSSLCGCVWTAQFIAYRCRTCATSPCMSLCAACFENGNHEGHDYNIFRSEAGGACDCGDASVMHKAGFCSHHGPNRVIPPPPPPGFLAAGKVLLDRIFLSVIQFLRNMSTYLGHDPKLPALFSHFLTFILDLIKLGSPVRSHLSQLLLNEKLYANLSQCKGYKCLENENSTLRTFHIQTNGWLKEAIEGMEAPHVVSGINDKGQFARAFQYKTYLDEITFWIVWYLFPEPLILIVLNLLPDADMKREFSKCFSRHYTRIAQSLSRTAELDPLSNRVVHISVQLFSNDDLAYMLCKEENLLEIFIISMHHIINPSLVPSQTHPDDMHQCVSCSSDMMRTNVYWPVVSDLVNILGHENVAKLLLNNLDLLQCWFQEVLSFCGMALNKRALDAHVEFEPDHHQMLIGFYTEREACASPLWCLLAALQNRDSIETSLSVIHSLLDTLQDFFDAIGVTETSSLRFDQVSFHYPLHRYLSHLISNSIKKQGATIGDFRLTETAARTLIIHPLQVLITSFEVQCAMWVRNGLYLASQSLAYRQYFFSRFFIDADLFLIQFCAAILPPHFIIASVFERCRVLSCLTVSDVSVIDHHAYPHDGKLGVPSEEKAIKMLESAFQIVQYVTVINCLKDASEEEMMRNEMISHLATKPSTFSSLSDHMPHSHESQTGKKSVDFINMLHRLVDTYAAKKEGDAMEQTKYMANDKAWELYDPLYTHYRSLYQRDVQRAHANYVNHLQETGELDSSVSETSLWPPYQPVNSLPEKFVSLGNLLRSRLLHSLIFIILHNEAQVTDSTISIALHLLESALRLFSSDEPSTEIRQDVFDQTWCLPLLKWYDADNPVANMIKVVSFERLTSPTLRTHSADDISVVNVVQTTECIASLLIKLHDKISGKQSSFSLSSERLKTALHDTPSSTRLNVISKILHIAAAKSKEAEQTIRVICKSLAPSPAPSDSPLHTSTSSEDQRENRRRRARLAQERLMKQFAMKQKQFLEGSESMDITDTDAKTSSDNTVVVSEPNKFVPGDWGLTSLPTYECVICGSTEVELQASDADELQCNSKLMGLICLLQPSFVLGQRTTSEFRNSLYKPGERPSSYDSQTCQSRVKRKHECWLKLIENDKFDLDLFAEQNQLATAVGSHVSTCGHYVHITCHSQYMEALRNQGRSQLSYDMIRAFQCPLCRQVSNLVLPCNVRAKQKNLLGEPSFRNVISKSWIDTLSDIISINESDTLGAVLARGSRDSSTVTPLAALIRYNLEVALMNFDSGQSVLGESSGSSSRLTLQRKSPIGSLFVLLHWFHRYGNDKDERDKCSDLVKRTLAQLSASKDAQPLAREEPLLMQDPVTVLIRLLLESPLLLDNFQSNVHLVYRLVFVQALLCVCCQFSHEERRAWKNNISVSLGGIPFSSQSIECLVGMLIHVLPNQLFDSVAFPSHSMDGGYVETVFSPQSVYGGTEKRLINFFRLSSILQEQLFPFKKLSSLGSSGNEFGCLASYLGFCSEAEITSVDVIKCLRWNDAKLILSHWCSEIIDVVEHDQDCARVLMCDQPLWCPPKLVKLPNDYSSFFQMYRMTPCHICGTIPKEPCLCLVCGEYVCYKNMCKAPDTDDGDCFLTPLSMFSFRNHSDPYASSRHARRCGAGTSILLQVNTTYVVIVRGTRCCFWGTLYLDAHGEEDREWRRGKPLFLKKQRLELLEQQWRHHLFDNTVKDWTGHRNII